MASCHHAGTLLEPVVTALTVASPSIPSITLKEARQGHPHPNTTNPVVAPCSAHYRAVPCAQSTATCSVPAMVGGISLGKPLCIPFLVLKLSCMFHYVGVALEAPAATGGVWHPHHRVHWWLKTLLCPHAVMCHAVQ